MLISNSGQGRDPKSVLKNITFGRNRQFIEVFFYIRFIKRIMKILVTLSVYFNFSPCNLMHRPIWEI